MPKTVLIGSDKSCDFPVAFEGVSSRHCRIRFEDGIAWVEDLDSTNGTYVDGRRIEPGSQQRIDPSSELSLGENVTLAWEDIRALRPESSAGRVNQQEARVQSSAAPSAYEPPRGHAGFWRRAAAALIDTLIVGVLGFLLGFVVSLFMIAGSSRGRPPVMSPAGAGVFFQFLGALLGWLYFALFESSDNQATPGKMVVGMKVTDLQGKQIGFGKATGRTFGKILSGIILYIGYFMAGFTEKHQTLHDIMAGTLVVNED